MNLININKYELRELTESYNKLLDYLYSQLLLLIKFNPNKYIKLQLIYFILSLTNYFYNINYNQYTKFDEIVSENEINILTEDEQTNLKNQETDNDELYDALDAEQEEYDEEEGGEQVLFTND